MFIIPKIEQLHSQDLTGASVLLNDVPEQSVSCNNWPVSFPETPQVSFRMASNGNDELFIRFTVLEDQHWPRLPKTMEKYGLIPV